MNKKSIISFMVLNVILITSMLLFLDRDTQLFGIKEACAQAQCVPITSRKFCQARVAGWAQAVINVPDTWTRSQCGDWGQQVMCETFGSCGHTTWAGCLTDSGTGYVRGSGAASGPPGVPSPNCGW